MKESYEMMVERHRQEITKLLDGCPHDEISDWKEYFWALGHSTGTFVKVCQFCQDEVAVKCCGCDEESNTSCNVCNMPFCDEHVKKVDYKEKVPDKKSRVSSSRDGKSGTYKVLSWKYVEYEDRILCESCIKEVKVVKIHEK